MVRNYLRNSRTLKRCDNEIIIEKIDGKNIVLSFDILLYVPAHIKCITLIHEASVSKVVLIIVVVLIIIITDFTFVFVIDFFSITEFNFTILLISFVRGSVYQIN